ncbi:MAG: RbsD/FucU domain-containing protein [Terracidiphilus sp.]
MSEFATAATGWETRFAELLPLFGHRNWIVVADAAYPAQAKAGIETIVAVEGQVNVLRKVLNAIAKSKHVRTHVYLDDELRFVPEGDAPGVGNYREELDGLLTNCTPSLLPHEQIIARLDQSAQLFRILIVKTDMAIPYTSVFFEFDCGYWNADAEQRLRQAILQAEAK